MIYITILIIFIIIFGLTIVAIVDKKMLNINESFINNKNTNKDINENDVESDESDSEESDNEESDSEEEENMDKFVNVDNVVCYENHCHNKCLRGYMNYPDPYMMTPLDKNYFKYNYQKNLSMQDYVNWLWLYSETEDELPYVHLRNLYKLRNKEKIIYPIKCDIKIIKNSEEYFKKIYDIDQNRCMIIDNNNMYEASNINQYPLMIKKST